MLIRNRDWKNWTEALPVEDADGAEDKKKPVTRPRPGHADLAGAIKYNFDDARYILERASARETAPIPPIAWPHRPRLPFTSPKQWCSST